MTPHIQDSKDDTKRFINNNTVDVNDNDVNQTYPVEIVWKNVFKMSILHLGALYGIYLWIVEAKLQTVIAWYIFALFSGMGITAGAHRLWSHKSYKAKLPLRILLMIMNSMALQNDIYEWSRDHRVHHKFSETNADPHNANRGFFFAHMGWLLCKKHPEVVIKGKTIDMKDLLLDPVVQFQRRFYFPLIILCCFLLPAAIPYYFWNENFFTAFYICSLFRYCFILHITWLVNSAAHLYGGHPYDKTIQPAENVYVSLATYGEGYHNYHHAFPWDYSTSELGWRLNWNFTAFFIESCEKIGLAYDLKKVSEEVVTQRMKRTGEPLDIIFINKKGYSLVGWIKVLFLIVCPLWINLIIRAIKSH